MTYNLFFNVVYVVDRSIQGFASFVSECMKDWIISKIKVFNHLVIPSKSIIGVFEIKFGLSDSSLLYINHIIIVDDSLRIAAFPKLFVRVSNNNIGICISFPYTGYT